MILIETIDKSQKRITLNIKANIMFADQCISEVDIELCKHGVTITPIRQIQQDLMPQPVLSGMMNWTDWFIARGFSMKSHRNIFFTELALDIECRNPSMPLILSLATNSVSLSDKYWLNPNETTEFIANGAKITFAHKEWVLTDPFQNPILPGTMDRFGLYDHFIVYKPESIDPASLIWTTHGEQNKRWLYENNEYYLEKKLRKSQFDGEVNDLAYFFSNGITVPDYSIRISELNGNNEALTTIYDLDTIHEGLYIIKKKCITGPDSFLERVSEHINHNDSSILDPINRLFQKHNISQHDAERFIEALMEYKQIHHIDEDQLLNSNNFGVLVDNHKAMPVVWGRIQRQRLWNCQIID